VSSGAENLDLVRREVSDAESQLYATFERYILSVVQASESLEVPDYVVLCIMARVLGDLTREVPDDEDREKLVALLHENISFSMDPFAGCGETLQ
jgi:hypothetical protein